MNLTIIVAVLLVSAFIGATDSIQIMPMRYLIPARCCNDGTTKTPSQNQKRPNQKSGVFDALILELLELTQEKVITAAAKPNKQQPVSAYQTYPASEKDSKTVAESLPSGLSLNQLLEASSQILNQNKEDSSDARRISATIVNGGNANTPEAQKAYACSQLQCLSTESKQAVCACNFKTGNVVSFKNECDLRKHNCRYDTDFKTILNEICPWEFESRRGNVAHFDYNLQKYFNTPLLR